jgi:hypothetical protein
MFATGRRTDVQTQRLGELPRACSQLTELPVQVVKDRSVRKPIAPRIDSAIPDAVRRNRIGQHAVLAGGADGDRTHDLRLAKPALSQLSYSP